MFLGNPDVVVAVWHRLLEGFQAGAARHGSGDTHHRGVFLAESDHGLAEDVLPVGWGAGLRRMGRAGADIVRPGAMKFFGMGLGSLETLALFGEDVKDDRLRTVFGVFEHSQEGGEIVAVDRADVTQAHLLENQAAAEPAAAVARHHLLGRGERKLGDGPLDPFLGFVRQSKRDIALGQLSDQAFEVFLKLVIARVGDEPVEVGGDGPHVLGDAPLVVVEDADEPFGGMADVV